MSRYRLAFFLIAQGFFLFLIQTPGIQARPVEANRFGSADNSEVWYRLENEEVRVDFAAENTFRIDGMLLTERGTDLAGTVDEAPTFWADRINGEEILSASAVLLKPRESDESGALLAWGRPVGTGASEIRVTKIVRLFPEGAQLEIGYKLENVSNEVLPVAYSVRLPWMVASGSQDARFYFPCSGSIRKVGGEEIAAGFYLEGLELTEPWFSATSPEADLSCLFVSDQPIVSWAGSRRAEGSPIAEVLMWEGTLKPGETHEGTCWVAAVFGLGTPVSVSDHYAVGTVWKPGYRFDSYCLETRLVGMPNGLKKFRLFSGVRRNSSSVAVVPVYTRRSRLSPTVVHKISMPGSYEEGTHHLEQSIYSSSHNLGYWNVALLTPHGESAARVSSTPSGPVTNLSYFLPPQENPTASTEPIGVPVAAEDYASALPQLSPVRAEPDDPSADEIALLEWPDWEG